jgi:hypothetical protein
VFEEEEVDVLDEEDVFDDVDVVVDVQDGTEETEE